MNQLKRILDFYIKSSIHVALAVFCMILMTYHMFAIPINFAVLYFAFFGTIVGYNFVKYDALARLKKAQMSRELKAIAVLSFVSFLFCGFYFFQLQTITKVVGFVFLLITLLYTLPFFPNKKNARNWVGVKIYIVALCWVGVTVVLPVLNAEIAITTNFYLKCCQRFILVFVLILVFEIIDLSHDDPHLKTVPQQIGVKKTKILGFILLLVFYFLEFLKTNFDKNQLFVNLILVVIVSLFFFYSNVKRSKYYTSFWAESIPILWFLLVIFSQNF